MWVGTRPPFSASGRRVPESGSPAVSSANSTGVFSGELSIRLFPADSSVPVLVTGPPLALVLSAIVHRLREAVASSPTRRAAPLVLEIFPERVVFSRTREPSLMAMADPLAAECPERVHWEINASPAKIRMPAPEDREANPSRRWRPWRAKPLELAEKIRVAPPPETVIPRGREVASIWRNFEMVSSEARVIVAPLKAGSKRILPMGGASAIAWRREPTPSSSILATRIGSGTWTAPISDPFSPAARAALFARRRWRLRRVPGAGRGARSALR